MSANGTQVLVENDTPDPAPAVGQRRISVSSAGVLSVTDSGGATTPAGGDGKALVSVADTTTDFLSTKIVAGAGISLSLLNPGGNEALEIASTQQTVGLWSADAPPQIAHAKDDEVISGSLSGQWAETDTDAMMTADVWNNHIRLSYTGAGTQKNAWLYQTVPAGGEFIFTTKLSVLTSTTPTNHQRLGICVLEDGADSSKKQHGIFLVPSLAQIYGGTWANYTAAETALGSPAGNLNMNAYLRMRCNGTTCSADYSTDGVSWYQVWTAVLTYTPAHFGLWMNNTSVITVKALYKFFRVQSGVGTSAYDATTIGRYV